MGCGIYSPAALKGRRGHRFLREEQRPPSCALAPQGQSCSPADVAEVWPAGRPGESLWKGGPCGTRRPCGPVLMRPRTGSCPGRRKAMAGPGRQQAAGTPPTRLCPLQPGIAWGLPRGGRHCPPPRRGSRNCLSCSPCSEEASSAILRPGLPGGEVTTAMATVIRAGQTDSKPHRASAPRSKFSSDVGKHKDAGRGRRKAWMETCCVRLSAFYTYALESLQRPYEPILQTSKLRLREHKQLIQCCPVRKCWVLAPADQSLGPAGPAAAPVSRASVHTCRLHPRQLKLLHNF